MAPPPGPGRWVSKTNESISPPIRDEAPPSYRGAAGGGVSDSFSAFEYITGIDVNVSGVKAYRD